MDNFLQKIKNIVQENEDQSLHTQDEIIEDICKHIVRGSDIEIERQVHDVIIKNIEYSDEINSLDHEYIGPLIDRKGVCDGISKLACLLFKKLGIESDIVYGDLCMGGSNQGGHAWNIVKIDGYWYHLDITENLALSDNETRFRYDYFNLSDVEISRDHKVDRQRFSCVKSNSSYYDLNGYGINNVDEYKKKFVSNIKWKEYYMIFKLPVELQPEESARKLQKLSIDLCSQYINRSIKIITSINAGPMIFVVSIVYNHII